MGGAYGGPVGPTSSAYPPPHTAYGAQSFGGLSGPVGRQQLGSLYAASASFDDEPPLLEGAGCRARMLYVDEQWT